MMTMTPVVLGGAVDITVRIDHRLRCVNNRRRSIYNRGRWSVIHAWRRRWSIDDRRCWVNNDRLRDDLLRTQRGMKDGLSEQELIEDDERSESESGVRG